MSTRDPSPWHGDARRSGASIGQALWLRLRERAPWLVRLGPWAISLASLTLGLCTLFVFRRGLPHVGWIVGYVLLLWLIFLSVAELRSSPARTGPRSVAMRRGREPRGRHVVIGAGEYVIQSLFHGLLLFVLPAYYAAATLSSVNVAFLAGLAGLA